MPRSHRAARLVIVLIAFRALALNAATCREVGRAQHPVAVHVRDARADPAFEGDQQIRREAPGRSSSLTEMIAVASYVPMVWVSISTVKAASSPVMMPDRGVRLSRTPASPMIITLSMSRFAEYTERCSRPSSRAGRGLVDFELTEIDDGSLVWDWPSSEAKRVVGCDARDDDVVTIARTEPGTGRGDPVVSMVTLPRMARSPNR